MRLRVEPTLSGGTPLAQICDKIQWKTVGKVTVPTYYNEHQIKASIPEGHIGVHYMSVAKTLSKELVEAGVMVQTDADYFAAELLYLLITGRVSIGDMHGITSASAGDRSAFYAVAGPHGNHRKYAAYWNGMQGWSREGAAIHVGTPLIVPKAAGLRYFALFGALQGGAVALTTDRLYATPSGFVGYQGEEAIGALINLRSFLNAENTVDVMELRQAIEILVLTLEAYATLRGKKGERPKPPTRPIMIGYAGLARVLLAASIPYDSAKARLLCAALCALLTGTAYAKSAELAKILGPCDAYNDLGQQPYIVAQIGGMRERVLQYISGAQPLPGDEAAEIPWELRAVALRSFEDAVQLGQQYGVRHADVSGMGYIENDAALLKAPSFALDPLAALCSDGMPVAELAAASVRQGMPPSDARAEIAALAKDPKHSHVVWRVDPVFATGNAVSAKARVRMMAAAQHFVSLAVVTVVQAKTHADAVEILEQAQGSGIRMIGIEMQDPAPAPAPMAPAPPPPVEVPTPQEPEPPQSTGTLPLVALRYQGHVGNFPIGVTILKKTGVMGGIEKIKVDCAIGYAGAIAEMALTAHRHGFTVSMDNENADRVRVSLGNWEPENKCLGDQAAIYALIREIITRVDPLIVNIS